MDITAKSETTMAEKVLVVEDDLTLQETLAYNLKRQGYEVQTVGDGKTGVDTARQFRPDLMVLDLMLPVLDGYEVCRILRREMSMPIIMLTARDGEIDRVLGLEMGADDYLTKPFSMRELLARVKAMLRRVQLDHAASGEASMPKGDILRFDNLAIDITRREVLVDGSPTSFKPKEYDLMLFIARHRGQVVSRELIMDRVWGWDFRGGSRTVDVHMRWLREKIEKDPANPARIVTVRGVGYRFEG